MIKNRKRILLFFIVILFPFLIRPIYADETVLYLKKYLQLKDGEITADKIVSSAVNDLLIAKELRNIIIKENNDSILIYPVKTLHRLIEKSISSPLSLIGDKIIVFPDNMLKIMEKDTLLSISYKIWQKYGIDDGRLELTIKDFKKTDQSINQNIYRLKSSHINIVQYSEKTLKCLIYVNYTDSLNNKKLQKLYAEVKRFIPVAYAVKSIHPGELLSNGVLEYRYKELTVQTKNLFERTFITTDNDITGYMANTHIESGEPILKRNLKVFKAVRSGERISINFITKGIAVAIKGYALSSGGINERVRVKSYESGNTFWGTVKSEGEVDVALP